MAVRASFEPVIESARAVGGFVGGFLVGRSDLNGPLAALLASELAIQAIARSRLTFDVWVELSVECVTVWVDDLSALLPFPVDGDRAADLAASDQGLEMIDVMADRWGIESTTGGTRAWFEVCRGSSKVG